MRAWLRTVSVSLLVGCGAARAAPPKAELAPVLPSAEAMRTLESFGVACSEPSFNQWSALVWRLDDALILSYRSDLCTASLAEFEHPDASSIATRLAEQSCTELATEHAAGCTSATQSACGSLRCTELSLEFGARCNGHSNSAATRDALRSSVEASVSRLADTPPRTTTTLAAKTAEVCSHLQATSDPAWLELEHKFAWLARGEKRAPLSWEGSQRASCACDLGDVACAMDAWLHQASCRREYKRPCRCDALDLQCHMRCAAGG